MFDIAVERSAFQSGLSSSKALGDERWTMRIPDSQMNEEDKAGRARKQHGLQHECLAVDDFVTYETDRAGSTQKASSYTALRDEH